MCSIREHNCTTLNLGLTFYSTMAMKINNYILIIVWGHQWCIGFSFNSWATKFWADAKLPWSPDTGFRVGSGLFPGPPPWWTFGNSMGNTAHFDLNLLSNDFEEICSRGGKGFYVSKKLNISLQTGSGIGKCQCDLFSDLRSQSCWDAKPLSYDRLRWREQRHDSFSDSTTLHHR